jgi:hypothetical protein
MSRTEIWPDNEANRTNAVVVRVSEVQKLLTQKSVIEGDPYPGLSTSDPHSLSLC